MPFLPGDFSASCRLGADADTPAFLPNGIVRKNNSRELRVLELRDKEFELIVSDGRRFIF